MINPELQSKFLNSQLIEVKQDTKHVYTKVTDAFYQITNLNYLSINHNSWTNHILPKA